MQNDKLEYAKAFIFSIATLIQLLPADLLKNTMIIFYIVQNPPARPLTQIEMDDVYALPYMRAYHPMYEKRWWSTCFVRDKVQSYK